jgi:hypothetical protein
VHRGGGEDQRPPLLPPLSQPYRIVRCQRELLGFIKMLDLAGRSVFGVGCGEGVLGAGLAGGLGLLVIMVSRFDVGR